MKPEKAKNDKTLHEPSPDDVDASARTTAQWLERLCEAERDIYAERARAFDHLAGDQHEEMAIATVQQIIQERIIPGKCDKCERVQGCMMTPATRKICGGPFQGMWEDEPPAGQKGNKELTKKVSKA